MGELVGLAIRQACECPMELNLEPASVAKARHLRRKQPFMILAGLCLLLCLAGLWLFYQRAAKVESQVLETLAPKVDALNALKARFDKTKAEIDDTQRTAAPSSPPCRSAITGPASWRISMRGSRRNSSGSRNSSR